MKLDRFAGDGSAAGRAGTCDSRAVPPFRYTTPVRFADVDHAGLVYYPRFFHFFHLAFEELWRARLGPTAYVELIDRDRIGFPAVRAECDFKAPLRFGDDAAISIAIEKLGGRSIVFTYRVERAADGVLAAEGKVVCAVTDLARMVAIPIPERVRSLVADLAEP